MRIILASSSSRRQQLLKAAGFDLKIFAPSVDESVLPGENPEVYVERLAKAKADFVSRDVILPVVAADTVVIFQNQILGKPKDENDAREMIRMLAGNEHKVLTGYAVKKGQVIDVQVVTTKVVFRPLTDLEIESYLITKEPFGKAGAYAIQGAGASLVDKVEGSLTNVIGLPIREVIESLRKMNGK